MANTFFYVSYFFHFGYLLFLFFLILFLVLRKFSLKAIKEGYNNGYSKHPKHLPSTGLQQKEVVHQKQKRGRTIVPRFSQNIRADSPNSGCVEGKPPQTAR